MHLPKRKPNGFLTLRDYASKPIVVDESYLFPRGGLQFTSLEEWRFNSSSKTSRNNTNMAIHSTEHDTADIPRLTSHGSHSQSYLRHLPAVSPKLA
jgi:hypothetical protein